MEEIYRSVIEGLTAKSVSAYFQGEDQLVISRQVEAILPSEGNSFWITNQAANWYLCTWSPQCYRVPAGADLVGLCAIFACYGRTAQARVPEKIIKRFGLVTMSEVEAAETFGW